jgi:hypothetical protein
VAVLCARSSGSRAGPPRLKIRLAAARGGSCSRGLEDRSGGGRVSDWTPQEATFGTVTAKREDVIKIERYRHGGSRAKHIGVGALIGFGGGFAVGAGIEGCNSPGCVGRREGGVVGLGVGAVIGAIIGALLPTHSKELIYAAK